MVIHSVLQPNVNSDPRPRKAPLRRLTALAASMGRLPGLAVLLCLGLGLALSSQIGGQIGGQIGSQMALAQAPPAEPSSAAEVGTVDPIPPEFRLGHSLYLEACASCHIGVPPAVLPVQSWQFILEEPGHYGVRISPPTNPGRLLIWQYLQQFSRSLQVEEPPPFRLENSRYFKALHPRVEFTEPVRLQGCVSCHPKAEIFNFRALTSAWADAP
ncbi:MAG: diheme cytochrome C [Elainellaceae cyanobacterium]